MYEKWVCILPLGSVWFCFLSRFLLNLLITLLPCIYWSFFCIWWVIILFILISIDSWQNVKNICMCMYSYSKLKVSLFFQNKRLRLKINSDSISPQSMYKGFVPQPWLECCSRRVHWMVPLVRARYVIEISVLFSSITVARKQSWSHIVLHSCYEVLHDLTTIIGKKTWDNVRQKWWKRNSIPNASPLNYIHSHSCVECIVASWDAAEGPDQESSDRNVSERQPAGPSGETGQRASWPRRPGALHRGEERYEMFFLKINLLRLKCDFVWLIAVFYEMNRCDKNTWMSKLDVRCLISININPLSPNPLSWVI